MIHRQVIDARRLPDFALDTREPVWWGNLILIFILTTSAAMIIGSYFYLARDFADWPPVQSNTHPAIHRPLPDLTYSSWNVALLVVSCIPAFVVDRSARRRRQWTLRIGLVVMALLGFGALGLRYLEFGGLNFRWNDNAYGSVTWGILGMHSLFLYVALVEMLLMMVWSWFNELDNKHAFDVTVVSLFWYWMAVVWLPMYAVVYWVPRLAEGGVW